MPRRTTGPARKAGSARKRVSKPAAPVFEQPLARRRWLRLLAYLWGALVMLAHVYNFGSPRIVTELLPRDIRDVVYHGGMFAIFTLLFRFSLYTPLAASRSRQPATAGYAADITALVVCCGWGALCELLQLRIPGREFHYEELALNMGVPLLVVALVGAAQRRRN